MSNYWLKILVCVKRFHGLFSTRRNVYLVCFINNGEFTVHMHNLFISKLEQRTRCWNLHISSSVSV